MEYRGLQLDRFQAEAFEAIDRQESVIVSAPTGSGKTMIAEYAIEKALASGKEVIYTAPIKALLNQKFRDFSHTYGNKVGIMTGDVTLNSDAPILVMTTEIFRNALFENIDRFQNVLFLILDEVHYIDDAERGSVWEESIIFSPSQIKTVCLSATVPNIDELANWMTEVRNQPVSMVIEHSRPVPLEEYCYLKEHGILSFKEAKARLPKKRKKNKGNNRRRFTEVNYDSFHDIVELLVHEKQLPCLYFLFSRRECEMYAKECAAYSFLDSEKRNYVRGRIEELVKHYNVKSTFSDRSIEGLLCRGVAYHHAGMIPAWKEIVEQLFTEGVIQMLFATETFALGVNMPATTVVFSRLKKYDGVSVRYLRVIEYQQMAGRAGRRGLDKVGYVYANIGEDENMIRQDLHDILAGPLEPITSQFDLSYGTLMSIYDRVGKDVVQTCEQSFGTYQRALQAQEAGGKKQRKKVSAMQRKLIKKKIYFLQTLGYLHEDGLTSKGRFAVFVNGYEIPITELFFDGFLENQNEKTLFLILVAICYEGKKNDRYTRIPKDVRKVVSSIEKRIDSCRKVEMMFDLSSIRSPDFRLTKAAYAWVQGKSFDEVMSGCDASAGDVIRTFRLAIQLCRHLQRVCAGYGSFIQLLDNCLMAVNRDEVNALKQLQALKSIPSK